MNSKQRWAAVAGAALAAVSVVVGWTVAGDGSGGPGRERPAAVSGGPASPGAPRGSTSPGAPGGPASPGAPGAGGEQDRLQDGHSGASGTGHGLDEPSGEQPRNQPPVIEEVDLSSQGLTLFIASTVSDPDGDGVSLLFGVDGDQVDPATACYESPACKGEEEPSATPTKAAIQLDSAEVGYRHEASVTVIATDSRGASSRETLTHEMAAIARVSFRYFQFTVARPADCFPDQSSRELAYRLDLSGAGTASFEAGAFPIDGQNPSPRLAGITPFEFVGQAAPPLRVDLRASFAGTTTGFAAPKTYHETEDVRLRFFRGDCEGYFSYRVEFTVS